MTSTTGRLMRWAAAVLLAGGIWDRAGARTEGEPGVLWRLSAGYAWRDVEGVRFGVGDHSSGAGIPRRVSSRSVDFGVVGDANRYANRTYDDGFVGIDPSTESNGDTWYWGYDEASQVRGGAIVFTRQLGADRRVTRETAVSEADSPRESAKADGAFVRADCVLGDAGGFTWGLRADATMTSFSSEYAGSTFRGSQRVTEWSYAIEDTYDLVGVVPPAAPYAGSYAGPGPLLPNRPVRRDVTTRVTRRWSQEYRNRVSGSVDADLWTLSAGVAGGRHLGPLFAGVSVAAAVHVATVDAVFRETLYEEARGEPRVVEAWSDAEEDTVVTPGAQVQIDAGAGVGLGAFVTVSGRYDWCERVEGLVGPSRYEFDLRGFSGMASVGWQF